MFDTVSYVHSSDPAVRDREKTVFLIRPLSVRAMIEINECYEHGQMGTGLIKVLENGLVGWKNLVLSKEQGSLMFSTDNLSYIPSGVRADLAKAISSLSVLDNEMVATLRVAARALLLRSKSKKHGEWDCQECSDIERKRRKCPFLSDGERMGGGLDTVNPALVTPWDRKRMAKGQLPRWAQGNSHPYDICPIGEVDIAGPGSMQSLCGLVVDSVRRDVLPVDPPVITAQPYIYQQARAIVIEEMNRLDAFYQARDEEIARKRQPSSSRSSKWRKTKQ